MIQRSFFKNKSEFSKSRISHGGDRRGRRKVFRPLDRKRPVHLTLKSSHARGKMSLTNNRLAIENIIEAKAAKYQIKIHRTEIMRNHIHMVVSFKSRGLMQCFMKTVTGLIARAITGARKGRAFGRRFWDHLAHTRIITGKRDFARLLKYLWKNEIEREEGSEYRWCVEDDERIERDRLKKERGRNRKSACD